MSLIGLRRVVAVSLLSRFWNLSFYIYSLTLFILKGCTTPKADMTNSGGCHIFVQLLRQGCVCILGCGSVYKSVQYVWHRPCPSGLRSPSSCSFPSDTFLGRALGQSSCLVHLSLPPFFTLFPLAGPLSLTAHAITQWHSFIYYCSPPSSSSFTLHHPRYRHKRRNAMNDTSMQRKIPACSLSPGQRNKHVSSVTKVT